MRRAICVRATPRSFARPELRPAGGNPPVDEPAQERLTVRVTTGSVHRWCLAFGGTIVTDRGLGTRAPGRFDARHAPAPDFCL